MKKTSQRTIYFFGLLIVLFLFAVSFYLEFVDGLMPCPLCMLQRACLGGLGILFLLAVSIHLKEISRFFLDIFALILAASGALLAGRQAWLQHNPLTSDNCDVSFQYMINVMPLKEVIKRIFTGGTECSRVNWQFLHLSLAEWSLICFVGFLILISWQLLRQK